MAQNDSFCKRAVIIINGEQAFALFSPVWSCPMTLDPQSCPVLAHRCPFTVAALADCSDDGLLGWEYPPTKYMKATYFKILKILPKSLVLCLMKVPSVCGVLCPHSLVKTIYFDVTYSLSHFFFMHNDATLEVEWPTDEWPMCLQVS